MTVDRYTVFGTARLQWSCVPYFVSKCCNYYMHYVYIHFVIIYRTMQFDMTMYVYNVHVHGSNPTRGSSFFRKVTALGVLCCFALLFVWPCLLLSSFLLHLSLTYYTFLLFLTASLPKTLSIQEDRKRCLYFEDFYRCMTLAACVDDNSTL